MFVTLRNLLLLAACLIVAGGQAWAVALGKIEVTSHLGEVFYAEAPVQLDTGEKIGDVSVELASPSDYQILEVFRDPALNKLGVNLVNDQRGTRAVITSTEAVDTPYFNLVLKLRYGHATNFKKYPVFLDLPEQVRPATSRPAVVPVQPSVQTPVAERPTAAPAAVQQTAPAAEPASEPGKPGAKQASGFQPYDGWARISRYGPMVHGDTISTVARRLPVDQRYTISQIMVGLYNKNKEKFRENNINLINAGTYLDVPTAKEIESVSDSQAKAILHKQNKLWNALKKQPRYAAEAEAQANRYRTRVRVGEAASGTAAAPVQATETQPQAAAPQATTDAQPTTESSAAVQDQLKALQQENQQLKQALQASEAKATGSQVSIEDAAAAQAQVKKLELTVARLQRQLKLVNQQLQEVQEQKMNSLTYAMGGIILLLIGVAGYLLFLLRRDRPHPAVQAAAPQEAEGVSAVETPGTADEVASHETEEGSEAFDHDAFAASLDAELQQHEPETETAGDELPSKPVEPVAQPGVDYLAEAEVYLRYGMDDEALQQMNLAIEQKPDDLQAHTKLVQFLQSRGDQAAVEAAIEAARSALSNSDLQAFESLLEEGTSAGSEAEEAAQAAEVSPDATADDEAVALDMTGMDLDFGDIQVDSMIQDGSDQATEDQSSEAEREEQDDALQAGDEFQAEVEPSAEAEEDLQGMDEFASAEIPTEPVTEESEGAEEQEPDEGMDFTSFTGEAQVDEAAGEEAEPESEEQVAPEQDDSGLDFVLHGDDVEQPAKGETEDQVAQEEPEGLTFDVSDIEAEGGEQEDEIESPAPDASAEELSEAGIRDESDQPTSEPEGESVGDALNIDDLLEEFADHEGEEAAGDTTETTPETTIESESDSGELALDEILGEFGSFDAEAEQVADESESTPSEEQDIPEMDVSDELDDLLAEWDSDEGGVDFEAGPEHLDVDRARSLLAEGSLDEAESALQAALDGERRADALIGLAEVAAKRGDDTRRNELLAEAEPLLDDHNRDWFQQVQNLSL